jgi:hypothetical protein
MKKINTFWNWFQDNNQTIKNLINETPINQKNINFWINKNLSYYCKEIDFIIIFPKQSNNKIEFIITANGNPEYYSQVMELIDNAPILKHWKLTAFIQPSHRIEQCINKMDADYIFQDIILKTDELKFLTIEYKQSSEKIDMIISLKNHQLLCNTKTLNQAFYIIMQNISLQQKISFVQLAQTPQNSTFLIHLKEFQTYFNKF